MNLQRTTTVEIRPTSPQALGVLSALDEAAAMHRLHVRSCTVTQTSNPTQDPDRGAQLYVIAALVDMDRRTPATSPVVQRLLREMGAAWNDMEPVRTQRGRLYWSAALAGQGIHLTVHTDIAVPVQGGQS